MATDLPPFVTISDVAAAIGYDESGARKLLNRLVRARKLKPPTTLGRRHRVWWRSDVEPIIETIKSFRDLTSAPEPESAASA